MHRNIPQQESGASSHHSYLLQHPCPAALDITVQLPNVAQSPAGRRRSLIIALLINAFFGLMSAGARSVGPLVAMRLLGGVGVGGSVPVVFSFLAELLPARAR